MTDKKALQDVRGKGEQPTLGQARPSQQVEEDAAPRPVRLPMPGRKPLFRN